MQLSLDSYLKHKLEDARKFIEIDEPKGLFVIENAIPPDLYDNVIKWYKSDEIQSKLQSVWRNNKGRKVIQYGAPYLYDKKTASNNKNIEAIPPLLLELIDLISDITVDKFSVQVIPPNFQFTQSIINRYLPGEGINPHTDLNDFGPIVASFTFLGGREMEFTKNIGNKTHNKKIYTSPKTLYIMTEDSRYKWKHQMRPRKTDNGKPRKECFSITFRCNPK